jgi:seryl-tRNA synthetase
MRSDPDLQTHSNTVRFRHEFFRKGQAELLQYIQRTTAKTTDSPPSAQVDDLKSEVATLNQKLEDMAGQMDKKLAVVADAMHQDYLHRVNQMEVTYKGMIRSLLVQQNQPAHPVHQKSMINHDFGSYMHSSRESA